MWLGVGCPCSPVRNDIVTPRHLFYDLRNQTDQKHAKTNERTNERINERTYERSNKSRKRTIVEMNDQKNERIMQHG